MTVPRTHPKPLEPWALELLRQDQAGDDPRTQQELAQLVALLRALPDPEPSPDLARRILEHVAEQESRPRVVHAVFGAARHADAARGRGDCSQPGSRRSSPLALSPESLPAMFGTETADADRRSGSSVSPTRRRPTVLVRPQFVSACSRRRPLRRRGSGPTARRSTRRSRRASTAS